MRALSFWSQLGAVEVLQAYSKVKIPANSKSRAKLQPLLKAAAGLLARARPPIGSWGIFGVQLGVHSTPPPPKTPSRGVYWDYPPLHFNERVFRRAVGGSLSLVGLSAMALAIYLGGLEGCCGQWLTFLSALAEVKVVISVVCLGVPGKTLRGVLRKYCPQVWLNFQRKSTARVSSRGLSMHQVGWTIYNVLLDFTGGA